MTGHDWNRDPAADTQVVILMGGLGTRLGLTDRPKAMADINGRPFFDYELMLLKRWGFWRFLFLVGHQAEMVEHCYGDGSGQGVEIRYSRDGRTQLGTGGALKQAEEALDESFILLYGDSFMDMDYRELVYRYWLERKAGKAGVMTVLKNENRYDKSNVIFRDGALLLYDKAEQSTDMKYIDYGVSMLSKEVLAGIEPGRACDLSELLTALSKAGKLAGQEVSKRFYEIGSPASREEFAAYAKQRFDTAKQAVFLDRDGVINEFCFNEETEQLDSPFTKEEFRYREHVLPTLKAISDRGVLLFIVTNQPAAAKGKVSLKELYDLNTWMANDLRARGIRLEASVMCPHHPAGDARTQAPFLIRRCGCRKPGAGMLTDILSIYNIDREHSWMAGDSYTDILAGKKAGLKTALLGEYKCDMCHRLEGMRPDRVLRDIREMEGILKREL